ncbi:MAG: LD-carboxypeptidase [Pseudomonadota bacterium]|nr:LD-carboxypeptidase [Pseudomonadota bacterium]
MLPVGARIAVVSPSGIFDPVRLEAGLAVVREWGYRPELLPGVGRRHRYLAGTDAVRLADLERALRGGWDAVWAARGGYGLSRLLGGLPWAELGGAPFIGFSDASGLLNVLAASGRPAVHGPVLNSLADLCDPPSRDHLRALLAGDRLPPLHGRVLRSGRAEGPLVGGNLCVLASLCGTPWQLRARACILLLEEVNEAPYKIDRMLTQLIDAGCLDGVAGVVFGSLLNADAPEGADWSMDDVLVDLLAPLGVPVLAGLPVGHGPANRAFRVGASACIVGDHLEIEA